MSFEKKRIYIVVKTYPTISERYAELVCTAGVLEDGSWIRLYPMPFRLLNDAQQYPKYTWIQADVGRNTSDFRPESYRPELSSIIVDPKPSKTDWEARRRLLLKKEVYTNLEKLIGKAKAKDNPVSLAMFKPTKILDFVIESDDRDWDPKKLTSLQSQSQQLNLFKTLKELEAEFRVVQKIPYKFSYRFEDDSGKRSKLMITDWEVGMLYINCLKNANGDERAAIANVKRKYLDYFLTRDIYFILGTTLQNHYVSRNPFIIIGVFYPPAPSPSLQISLFDI